MKSFKVIEPLMHDGVNYAVGDALDLDTDGEKSLIELGVVEAVKPNTEDKKPKSKKSKVAEVPSDEVSDTDEVAEQPTDI